MKRLLIAGAAVVSIVIAVVLATTLGGGGGGGLGYRLGDAADVATHSRDAASSVTCRRPKA